MTQIILCEQTGVWAEAMRRQLLPEMALVEMGRLEDVWEPLEQTFAGLVVLEFTPERDGQLFLALLRLAREFPLAVPLAVLSPQHAQWEAALREAGAVHVVTSLRRVGESIDIAARYAARLHTELADDPRLPPRPQPSIEERILASLPWGE